MTESTNAAERYEDLPEDDCHPCVFSLHGATQTFCQEQSGIPQRSVQCATCSSPWRICRQCALDGVIDPVRSVVVNPERGLCETHNVNEPPDTDVQAENDRLMASVGNTKEEHMVVPVSTIRPRKDQPREHFDQDGLVLLAESIKAVGQVQACSVVKIERDADGHEFELDDGERRWRALQIARIKDCKVVLKSGTQKSSVRYLRSVISNFGKEDHTILEEVDMLVRLVDEYGYSQTAIARAIGKDPMWVSVRYGLRRLHPEVRAMLDPECPRQERLGFVAAVKISRWPYESQPEVAEKARGVGQHMMDHTMQQVAKEKGLDVPTKRHRKPSRDLGSVRKSVTSIRDRLMLLTEMDEHQWKNAFLGKPEAASELMSDVDNIVKLAQRVRKRLERSN